MFELLFVAASVAAIIQLPTMALGLAVAKVLKRRWP